ncbi:MAG TPA: YceD family protein [Galbitalea sp.]|nr:YceD family protein [Galbitalea sp.]
MPKSPKNPYTVSVIDILHRPGEMREKSIETRVDDEMGNAVIGVRKGAELDLDVRLESLHDGILVSGEVDTQAEGECVRCLIDVRVPVQVEFQELFAYSFDEAFDYTVQDDSLDLEPLVRDAVVLSLPFQPVCQEDCTGLCPECGVRLLDNPGHEHEAPVDPRWAALAGLDGLVAERPDTDDNTVLNESGAAKTRAPKEKR